MPLWCLLGFFFLCQVWVIIPIKNQNCRYISYAYTFNGHMQSHEKNKYFSYSCHCNHISALLLARYYTGMFDLEMVLLGHSSSKTTEIYTHVSTRNIEKIKSPGDFLYI